jgi:Clp amino terminal domain, pathogenicity island component
MFERYTEGARRTIFFARYEASNFGSTRIEPQHILLGLLREDVALFESLRPKVSYRSVHQETTALTSLEGKRRVSTSADLSLDDESKRVLKFAAEEADRLNHDHIGTEHLLLGLLREGKSRTAKILKDHGARLPDLRLELEKVSESRESAAKRYPVRARSYESDIEGTVEIHGSAWRLSYIQGALARCRECSWLWQKCSWTPRDVVLDRRHGSWSFDLSLAQDAANFELMKGGWKKDYCAVCRWELFESSDDPSHATGFTNGRDWLCTECYERFFARPGFSSAAYGEIT